ncbi:MAG: L,D-transpeptidase family protein [Clostridia bacterium]|nr:L,D-transpeptidase family protein [Clostridia bacterium]
MRVKKVLGITILSLVMVFAFTGMAFAADIIDFSQGTVTKITAKMYYTGEKITQKNPVLTVDGEVIPAEVYDIEYKNNKNVGEATLTFKPKEEYKEQYTGEISASFQIAYQDIKSTSLKYSNNSQTGHTIKWDAVKGVEKYKIERKCSGEVKYFETSETSYAFTRLSAGHDYAYKVSPVYKDGHEGKASSVKSVPTKPKKTSIKKLVNTSSLLPTITWGKVTYADKYQIQASTSSSFKTIRKTVTVSASKLSSGVKTLINGKKYYFRVRAINEFNGVKAYGEWCTKKSLTVKTFRWYVKNGCYYAKADGGQASGVITIYEKAAYTSGKSYSKACKYYFSKGQCLGTSKGMWDKVKKQKSSKKYLLSISASENRVFVWKHSKGGSWYVSDIMKCCCGQYKYDKKKKANVSMTYGGVFKTTGNKVRYFTDEDVDRYVCYNATTIHASVRFHSQLYKIEKEEAGIPEFFKEWTPDRRFYSAAMGKNASHGCIRLYREDAIWIFNNIGKGTTVVIIGSVIKK